MKLSKSSVFAGHALQRGRQGWRQRGGGRVGCDAQRGTDEAGAGEPEHRAGGRAQPGIGPPGDPLDDDADRGRQRRDAGRRAASPPRPTAAARARRAAPAPAGRPAARRHRCRCSGRTPAADARRRRSCAPAAGGRRRGRRDRSRRRRGGRARRARHASACGAARIAASQSEARREAGRRHATDARRRHATAGAGRTSGPKCCS